MRFYDDYGISVAKVVDPDVGDEQFSSSMMNNFDRDSIIVEDEEEEAIEHVTPNGNDTIREHDRRCMTSQI